MVFQVSGLQDCMVQLHPREGLNVLGVAVVTTPPHKRHQPPILLLYVISNHRAKFTSSSNLKSPLAFSFVVQLELTPETTCSSAPLEH